MQASSRPVHSTQQAVHARLADLVHKHANSDFRKPPAAYSQAALARLYAVWDRRAPLVLDAGCGTGVSTLALARLHPDCLVIGVDQSQVRLAAGARSAGATPPDNALLLRADVVDIWLLLARERLRLARHYLLYPNPWPKPAQVMRRCPRRRPPVRAPSPDTKVSGHSSAQTHRTTVHAEETRCLQWLQSRTASRWRGAR